MDTTMLLLIFSIIGFSIAIAYILGKIPYTDPHMEKRFEQYYLGILNASTCGEIKKIISTYYDEYFIDYVKRNFEKIVKQYPQELLANKVNPMNCVDDTGEAILF